MMSFPFSDEGRRAVKRTVTGNSWRGFFSTLSEMIRFFLFVPFHVFLNKKTPLVLTSVWILFSWVQWFSFCLKKKHLDLNLFIFSFLIQSFSLTFLISTFYTHIFYHVLSFLLWTKIHCNQSVFYFGKTWIWSQP